MLRIILICLVYSLLIRISQPQFATWNMFGACDGDQSNWFSALSIFITRENLEVVAVQEAGSIRNIPTTSTSLDDMNINNPDNVPTIPTGYRWNRRTESRERFSYIYFLNLDTGANRVNLAIVSNVPADEVIVLDSGVGRPALGIRRGDDYFFSIHADSKSRANGPDLVNRIYQFMQTQPPNRRNRWMIMGDFNRDPTALIQRLRLRFPQVEENVRPINQHHFTQRSGHNIDYAIVADTSPFINLMPSVMNFIGSHLINSDHKMVIFKRC